MRDSIKIIWLGIGAMDGRMAPGSPAGAVTEVSSMVDVADTKTVVRVLDLSVTAQAQIGVTNGEEFWVYRAVRRMAGGATFT